MATIYGCEMGTATWCSIDDRRFMGETRWIMQSNEIEFKSMQLLWYLLMNWKDLEAIVAEEEEEEEEEEEDNIFHLPSATLLDVVLHSLNPSVARHLWWMALVASVGISHCALCLRRFCLSENDEMTSIRTPIKFLIDVATL